MEQRKNNSSSKKALSDKKLPWWVELLFVQIGLPDKWLVYFLKTNKNLREIFKNEKRALIAFVFFVIALAYFQPVIKYSRSKLKCQSRAEKYIKNIYPKEIDEEIATLYAYNYCNGGNQIEDLIVDKD
mgnify:FL=1